jgi:hypothetical protein
VDRRFLGTQKYYHYRRWYRHELAPFVEETILDPGTLRLPFLDRTAVERDVKDHVRGRGNYTLEIHKLLALAFIERDLLKEGSLAVVTPTWHEHSASHRGLPATTGRDRHCVVVSE